MPELPLDCGRDGRLVTPATFLFRWNDLLDEAATRKQQCNAIKYCNLLISDNS